MKQLKSTKRQATEQTVGQIIANNCSRRRRVVQWQLELKERAYASKYNERVCEDTATNGIQSVPAAISMSPTEMMNDVWPTEVRWATWACVPRRRRSCCPSRLDQGSRPSPAPWSASDLQGAVNTDSVYRRDTLTHRTAHMVSTATSVCERCEFLNFTQRCSDVSICTRYMIILYIIVSYCPTKEKPQYRWRSFQNPFEVFWSSS